MWARKHVTLQNGRGREDPKKLNPETAEVTSAEMSSLGATALMRRRNGKQKQRYLMSRLELEHSTLMVTRPQGTG